MLLAAPFEIRHFGVDPQVVRAHQPADGVPVVAVDFRQHAVRAAQVARPGRRQARPVRVGFDHHRRADLAVCDALRRRREFRVEAAHETQLQDHLVLLGHRQDLVALLQVERHRFFQEDVLAVLGCQRRQRQVGGGGGGDDHRLEIRLSQRLLQAVVLGFDAKIGAGLLANFLYRLHQRHDLAAGTCRVIACEWFRPTRPAPIIQIVLTRSLELIQFDTAV